MTALRTLLAATAALAAVVSCGAAVRAATMPATGAVLARTICDADGRCFDSGDPDVDRPPPHHRFDRDDEDRPPPRRFDPDDEDRPPPPRRRHYDPDDDRPPPPPGRFREDDD